MFAEMDARIAEVQATEIKKMPPLLQKNWNNSLTEHSKEFIEKHQKENEESDEMLKGEHMAHEKATGKCEKLERTMIQKETERQARDDVLKSLKDLIASQ
ncbi:hypothetical protein L5515_003020 [Caenorhabditis briggsae]|nr:hypothetical protein L3Y34_000132 [Caenorhabditis briggsae]UMM21261.1 hypothetical protein L5515_003020 [Caenorhabditis briggsae]